MSETWFVSGSQDVVIPSPGATSLILRRGSIPVKSSICEFILSTNLSSNDDAINWIARRFTARGTGSPLSPTEITASGSPARILAEEDQTVEPTYTTKIFDQDFNQREAYHHVMSPGHEWLIPYVADGGIGWTAIHPTYAGGAKVSTYWRE